MPGRPYLDKVSIGPTSIFSVVIDPNGVVPGAIGDLALRYAGAVDLYQNMNGALAWTVVGNSYPPAVPADWALPPTTKNGALDQIVRNGAGHFQKARDPLLTPAPTIYVRTTGNDSTGDGTLPLPFASVARALQALPEMPEYGGSFPTVDVGPGTFPLPTKIDLGFDITLSPAPMTVAATYLIDASQPVNTKTTSTRLVLDTLALAATVPIGTRVNITATVAPGTALRAVVCRSDNSGVGGRLVLWVATNNSIAPYFATVAVGTSIEILAFATTFKCQDYTEIKSGYIFNSVDITGAMFTSAGGGSAATVLFNGCDVEYSNFSVSPYVGAGGLFAALPYTLQPFHVDQLAPLDMFQGGVGNVPGGQFVRNRNGDTRLVGEFASIGCAFMLAANSGAMQAQDTVLRAFAGTGCFLTGNDGADIAGYGALRGAYSIGDCLEPRDLAGAVIAGSFTGTFLMRVGALKAVSAALGSASSITVGAVLNPVAIGGTALSADASGTRITGGTPAPGGWGPSVQRVTATGQTWDGVSETVALVSATIGAAGVFNLPATDAVTTAGRVKIKNVDGTNAVAITPDLLGEIDYGGAGIPIALGGGGSPMSVELTNESIVPATARNWMITG